MFLKSPLQLRQDSRPPQTNDCQPVAQDNGFDPQAPEECVNPLLETQKQPLCLALGQGRLLCAQGKPLKSPLTYHSQFFLNQGSYRVLRQTQRTMPTLGPASRVKGWAKQTGGGDSRLP